jgi:hypothetical protein
MRMPLDATLGKLDVPKSAAEATDGVRARQINWDAKIGNFSRFLRDSACLIVKLFQLFTSQSDEEGSLDRDLPCPRALFVRDTCSYPVRRRISDPDALHITDFLLGFRGEGLSQ